MVVVVVVSVIVLMVTVFVLAWPGGVHAGSDVGNIVVSVVIIIFLQRQSGFCLLVLVSIGLRVLGN